MFTGNCNSKNMFGMNNMYNMNMFGSNNMLGQLFSGTGSIFDQSGFNPFGMMNGGCSIFTNCNGQPNWDAMAGFGVGMTVLNLVTGIFGHHLATKKTESNSSVEADIKGIQKQIDAKLEELDSSVTEVNYKDFKATEEDWYKEAEEEINDDEKEIKGKLSETKLNDQEKISGDCETKINELKQAKLAAGADVAELDKQIAAQVSIKKDADDAIKAHNEAVKAERKINNRRKELKEKADKRQKEINKIIDKITELIDQRNNAQAILDEKQEVKDSKKVSKAIGKEKDLIDDKAYNDALATHIDEDKSNDTKFTKAHLQKAAAKYLRAATDDQKTKAKDEFNKIYDWLYYNAPSEITDKLSAIANIMA